MRKRSLPLLHSIRHMQIEEQRAILAAKYPPHWNGNAVSPSPSPSPFLISLMDPRDYSTIILFVQAPTNERTNESRKQKPEPVQKLNPGSEASRLLVGAPLKNSGGATLSLYRRPGSLVVHRRRRLNIISCPYRLLPIAGRRRRGRRLLPLRLLPLRSTEREI